jgi:1,2-diacylglycerol 3-alpha-glucosyltransferase
MRICILALNRSREGSERLYNAQDIGLGKAFTELGHVTNVIHFEKRESPDVIEKYSDLLTISHFNVSAIGGNSIGIKKFLPIDVDVMICFSDVQISFPQVYHHCQKNNIALIPYIGVIMSHSTNPIKRILMHVIEKRNLSLYRTLLVCAKTESIKKELLKKNVKNIVVAPVCLDKENFISEISKDLRESLRFSIVPSFFRYCKVIIFVGKLVEEKRPLEALEIFYKLFQKDDSYRLIMIGSGPLKKDVENFIFNRKLDNVILLQEKIPNKDMWRYYVSADCSLNLNRVEIFGMSILEAMYYECPVVAFAAPGPEMIISDKIDGYLFNDVEGIENLVEKAISNGRLSKAKETIETRFMWTKTAEIMLQQVGFGGNQ